MKMILYPNEMDRIAKATRLVQEFIQNLNEMYNSTAEINFEGPECITVKVIDGNGQELGVIDWTDHGIIGFVSNDHES